MHQLAFLTKVSCMFVFQIFLLAGEMLAARCTSCFRTELDQLCHSTAELHSPQLACILLDCMQSQSQQLQQREGRTRQGRHKDALRALLGLDREYRVKGVRGLQRLEAKGILVEARQVTNKLLDLAGRLCCFWGWAGRLLHSLCTSVNRCDTCALSLEFSSQHPQ